jgi:hypothetical protein
VAGVVAAAVVVAAAADVVKILVLELEALTRQEYSI